MTKKERLELKKKLLARHSRLAAGLRAQLTAVRHSGQRRVSDSIDIATDALQDLESLQLAEMGVQELKRIDGALRRIDAGTFEICEECHGPIGRARLQALPQANLCLHCQEQLEREEVCRQPREHWRDVSEGEEEMERSMGVPDKRVDGAVRRH